MEATDSFARAGKMGVGLAFLGARVGARWAIYRRRGREGELGVCCLGEGRIAMQGHGDELLRRVAQRDAGGACRVEEKPWRSGFVAKPGARRRFGSGHDAWPARWSAPAYGRCRGLGAGRRKGRR